MQEDDIVTVDTVEGYFVIDQLVGIWACLTSIVSPNLALTIKQSRLTVVTFSSEFAEFSKEHFKQTSNPTPINTGGPTKPLTVPKESGKEIT